MLVKLSIALGMLALTSLPSHAKPTSHIQEFCGDRYCGQYRDGGTVLKHRKAAHKKYRSFKTVRSHKIKKVRRVQVASLGNEPMREAPSVSTLGGDLVATAKSYLGTNPTGWRSVWCGRFMALIAPNAARRVKNPNWARDWAALPRTAPRIGAIAVLSRGRGGHIGVVSGFDRRGNPIIISGNSRGRVVSEGTYSKHRILAYVEG